MQNGQDTHKKLAIICAFSLVFNEIASHLIDSPLPLFTVEHVRLSDRFCGHNNIEMGRRGKRKQRCPRLVSTVSQLFLHEIVGLFQETIRMLQGNTGQEEFGFQ